MRSLTSSLLPSAADERSHFVGSLDLPPVPAREFVEARTGRCGGDAAEFGCLIIVVPAPQHQASWLGGGWIERPVLEVGLGPVQGEDVVEHPAVHRRCDTGCIGLG